MAAAKNSKDTKGSKNVKPRSTAKKELEIELDKDYIYNLIMPSRPAPQSDEEPEEEKPAEAAEEELLPDPAAALKERLFARQTAGVALPPAPREYLLVNLTELLLANYLDDALEKFSCCKCDKCRKDIAAYALNLLPSEYVAAQTEEIPGLLEKLSVAELSGALIKAILHVRGNPRH